MQSWTWCSINPMLWVVPCPCKIMIDAVRWWWSWWWSSACLILFSDIFERMLSNLRVPVGFGAWKMDRVLLICFLLLTSFNMRRRLCQLCIRQVHVIRSAPPINDVCSHVASELINEWKQVAVGLFRSSCHWHGSCMLQCRPRRRQHDYCYKIGYIFEMKFVLHPRLPFYTLALCHNFS